MKKNIMPLLLLLLFAACAAQKKVETKVEKEIQETSVVEASDVAGNAREYILKSTTLSDLQKKSLLLLQDKTNTESRSLIGERNKTQLVLIKTVLEPKVDEKEVYILKRKIKNLEKKRINLDEKSFEEARKIIDPLKEVRDREFLYNSFLWRHNYW